jgi:hypothetical protein
MLNPLCNFYRLTEKAKQDYLLSVEIAKSLNHLSVDEADRILQESRRLLIEGSSCTSTQELNNYEKSVHDATIVEGNPGRLGN